MKTMLRLVLAVLVSTFLFFSCGSGGAGGGNPPVMYSISVLLDENPNGDIWIVEQYVRVPAGTTITLYVEPDTGYSLDTLSYSAGNKETDLIEGFEPSDDPYFPGTGVVTFTMPAANTVVKGTFAHNSRKIATETNQSAFAGGIRTDPARTARYTENVTVTVVTSSYYRIMKDQPDDPAVSYSYTYDNKEYKEPLYEPYAFSMPDADVVIKANLEPIYRVFITNDSSKGTVIIRNEDGALEENFAEGEPVSVRTNVTDTWYAIDKITVNNSSIGDITDSRNFLMPAANVVVNVTYKLNPANSYQLGVLVNGGNGTMAARAAATGNTPLFDAKAGDPVYLDIQPVAGYEIDPGNFSAGSDAPITIPPSGRPYFTMPAHDVTVSGAFRLKDLKITGTSIPSGAGTITPSSSTAKMGDRVTASVTAIGDFRLKTGTVQYSYVEGGVTKGGPLSASNNYRFTMPGYDVTISAEFAPLYTVSSTNTPPSTGNPAPGAVTITNSTGTAATKFAAGDRVYVGINVTNDWYVVDTVYGNNGVGNISGSFIMPDGPVNVTVTYKLNPANQYQIATTVPGGHGTIASKAAATGDTSLSSTIAGEKVYLEIAPIVGYELTPDSLDAGSDAPITIPDSGRPYFDMPPHDVTASGTFRLKDLSITGTALPSSAAGNVEPRLAGSAVSKAKLGDVMTVAVSAKSGYRLVAGTEKYSYNNGTTTITSALSPPSYGFSMPAYPVTVSAEFEPLYTVTLTTPSNGTAEITDGSGNVVNPRQFVAGETVKVSTVPATGYTLDTIKVNGATITGSSFQMPAGSASVTVAFKLVVYSITVNSATHGQINASVNEAVMNTTVNVSIQPELGYELTSLKYNPGDNTITNDGSSGSFKMPPNNVTITGTFALKTLNVTKTNPVGGTITLSTATAKMGDTVTFTVSPAANYRLKAGSVKYSYSGKDYTPSLSGSIYSFDMPPADVTVSADFEALYSVTVNNDDSTYGHVGNVSITSTGGTSPTSFAEGDRVVVSITMIDPSYVPKTISGDNGVGNISGYFTMPSGPVTVSVTYESNPLNQYSITHTQAGQTNGSIQFYDAASGGSILSTAKAGVTVYLDIQPEPGYELTTSTLSAGVLITMNGFPANPAARPSFVMPAVPVAVSGTFGLKDLSVTGTPIPSGAGMVEINGSAVTTAQMGQSLTVAVSANGGYRFKPGTVKYSYNDGTARNFTLSEPYGFIMPAYPVTVSAEFDPLYAVTLTAPSNGSAQITDSAGNVMASPAQFITGETVKINYTPATGYTFDTVRVNGSAITGTSFPMPAGITTVTVTFKPIIYSITVNSVLHGQISSSVSEAAMGATVYLDNTPEPGYELTLGSLDAGAGVTIDTSGARPFFVMPPGNVTVNGTFAPKTLSIMKTNPEGGIITLSTATAKMGQPVTFTVAPTNSNDYRLKAETVKYSYNGNDQTPDLTDGTYSFIMPAYDTIVSAEFAKLFTVTAPTPSNGSVTIKDENDAVIPSPGRFAAGDRVTVVTTPATGYTLDTIKINGTAITSGEFTMPAVDATVTVTFRAQVYTISMGLVLNGNISVSSPEGAYGAKMDDTVVLYTEPDPGFKLDSVSAGTGVDITTIVSGQSYSFGMPPRNVTVNGGFSLKTLNVTGTSSTGGGSVTIKKDDATVTTAKMDDDLTVVVTPDSGYRLKEGTVKYSYNDGTARSFALNDPYEFTMPAYNTTVSAEFEKVYSVTLTDTVIPDGSTVTFTNASGVETNEFAAWEQVNINVMPAAEYRVDSIIANGVEITDTRYFFMSAANATVQITFARPAFDINIDYEGNGSVNAAIKGAVAYKANEDDMVTLTLSPGTGYKYLADSLTVTKGADPVDTEIIESTAAQTTAKFTMPDNMVSVFCSFERKTYTIQKEQSSFDHGSISFINPTDPNGGEIEFGRVVSIKATPDLGYRVNSMTYYVQGQDPSTGVTISPGTTYQFTVPNFDDGATILVHVEFVPAIFSLTVNSGVSNGKIVFRNANDPSGTQIYEAPYLDTIIAELTINEGYYYSPNSFKINSNTVQGLVEIPGPAQNTVQFAFTMTPNNATINVTLTKNKYTLQLVNSQPEGGTVTMSPATTANHGDDINFTITPIEGYKAFQVKFTSPNAQKEYNIVNPTTDNKYKINLSDFTGVPTNGDTFTVNVSFVAVNGYLTYTPDPNINIRLETPQGIYLGSNVFVPTNSQIVVVITNSTTYRYRPGSLKLNGVTPPDLPSGVISYYVFTMPANNVTVSVESELIPFANISFNDPNMDSYIYFYGNKVEDLPDMSMFKIEEATPGQKVELRVQKLLYMENDTEVFAPIQNTIVKSWRLDGNLVASNTNNYTLPPGCSGKTLGVVVEIGGIPHSKSILVR